MSIRSNLNVSTQTELSILWTLAAQAWAYYVQHQDDVVLNLLVYRLRVKDISFIRTLMVDIFGQPGT